MRPQTAPTRHLTGGASAYVYVCGKDTGAARERSARCEGRIQPADGMRQHNITSLRHFRYSKLDRRADGSRCVNWSSLPKVAGCCRASMEGANAAGLPACGGKLMPICLPDDSPARNFSPFLNNPNNSPTLLPRQTSPPGDHPCQQTLSGPIIPAKPISPGVSTTKVDPVLEYGLCSRWDRGPQGGLRGMGYHVSSRPGRDSRPHSGICGPSPNRVRRYVPSSPLP